MKLRIGSKIVALVLAVALLQLIVTSAAMLQMERQANKDVAREWGVLVQNEIGQIARSVRGLVETANDLVQQQVDNGLKLARDLMTRQGQPALSAETVTWQAENQLTHTTEPVTLPKLMFGDTWLGQNRDTDVNTPIVDEVKRLSGITSTVFQRMNAAGDMLRVATSVEGADGHRAIGTYIPVVNADGKPNPVLSAVLRGETFRGRAFVVNSWYLTAYEPVRDRSGEIVGMLYVGVDQKQAVDILRKSISDAKVGKTGYVYVIGGSGEQQGHYIVSQGGQRDGESIWGVKDSDGNPVIQSIVTKALALKKGEIAYQRYQLAEQG